MKTIELFTEDAKKSLRTVKSWIRKGLVNGATYTEGEYHISDLARPPYTRASSKNAASIRKSIVIACKRRLSVNAKVFKDLSDYEFSVYADQVIALGLVEKRIIDGCIYYYATAKADSLTEKQIYKLFLGLTETVVSAAVGAATEKMLVTTKNQ